MLNPAQADQALGQPLYDVDRDELGHITQVYLHAVTGAPEWASVRTGPAATHESLVPLAEATMTGAGLSVPYSKTTVVTAPQVETDDGVLSPTGAAQLYRYYGVGDSQEHPPPGPQDDDEREHNNPSSSSGEEGLTRSEERLKVATTTHATQTVRLRKHIVTEEKTITISVRREVITLDREPVAEHDTTSGGGGLGTEPSHTVYETVLHEEQLVVEKKVVPVERVTLVKDLITEQQEITEQVRKEQIETDITDSDGNFTGQGTTKR